MNRKPIPVSYTRSKRAEGMKMSKYTLSNTYMTCGANKAAKAVKDWAKRSGEVTFVILGEGGQPDFGWIEDHPSGMSINFHGNAKDDLLVLAGLIETLPEADLGLPIECNYLRAYARRFKKGIIDALVAIPNHEEAGNTAIFHIVM